MKVNLHGSLCISDRPMFYAVFNHRCKQIFSINKSMKKWHMNIYIFQIFLRGLAPAFSA